MRLFGLTALAALAACGLGFNPRAQPDGAQPPDAAIDASVDAPVDAPPDAPPPVLGCTPARFTIDSSTQFITAVGTRRGFDVFTVDGSNFVHGYAFQFVGSTLEPLANTGAVLAVPQSIGPVAAVALEPVPNDDIDVAIAVPYPPPALTTTPAVLTTRAVGTVVVPFNAQLQRVDVPEMATMSDGLIVGPGALTGGDGGTLAYLAQDDSGHLAIQAVSRRGVVSTASKPVDTNNHSVTRQTLMRAASGYLAVWSDNALDPHEAITAAAIDENLASHPPLTISVNPTHGSFVPGAAYLASAHKYLFGWMEKPSHDFIHLTLRDEQLAPPLAELDLQGAEGTVPIIAAGDNDFLAVWQDPSLLKAARVDASGGIKFIGPTNTTGSVAAYDVISQHGQPVLFWVEKDGSGPNLWIDPLCQ